MLPSWALLGCAWCDGPTGDPYAGWDDCLRLEDLGCRGMDMVTICVMVSMGRSQSGTPNQRRLIGRVSDRMSAMRCCLSADAARWLRFRAMNFIEDALWSMDGGRWSARRDVDGDKLEVITVLARPFCEEKLGGAPAPGLRVRNVG